MSKTVRQASVYNGRREDRMRHDEPREQRELGEAEQLGLNNPVVEVDLHYTGGKKPAFVQKNNNKQMLSIASPHSNGPNGPNGPNRPPLCS